MDEINTLRELFKFLNVDCRKNHYREFNYKLDSAIKFLEKRLLGQISKGHIVCKDCERIDEAEEYIETLKLENEELQDENSELRNALSCEL